MFKPSVSPLASTATSVYAPVTVEHTFDTFFEGETGHGNQIQAESTPHLLTAQSSQRAGSPVTREELLAVKTAQMVADHIAESAHEAMTLLGDEFSPSSFIIEAARAMAGLLAPVLQPLNAHQRAAIVERAVDPTSCDEALDLILDGIGSMLRVYALYLKPPEWTCLQNLGCDYLDGRVIAWEYDGSVVVDLLDFNLPELGDWARNAEIREVCAAMYRLFGVAFMEFYPTRTPDLARAYIDHDEWYPVFDDTDYDFDYRNDAA